MIRRYSKVDLEKSLEIFHNNNKLRTLESGGIILAIKENNEVKLRKPAQIYIKYISK